MFPPGFNLNRLPIDLHSLRSTILYESPRNSLKVDSYNNDNLQTTYLYVFFLMNRIQTKCSFGKPSKITTRIYKYVLVHIFQVFVLRKTYFYSFSVEYILIVRQ